VHDPDGIEGVQILVADLLLELREPRVTKKLGQADYGRGMHPRPATELGRGAESRKFGIVLDIGDDCPLLAGEPHRLLALEA
jgi:hypothetical protein